jgi:ribokinase
MGVCVLGSINLDIVCAVAELPAPGETLAAASVSRFPGGKGLNQAVAAARWGAPTAMIGQVGEDEAGRELLEMLAAAGITTAGVTVTGGAQTGQAYLFVSAAGENMIVVAGGANLSLPPPRPAPIDLAGYTVFLSQLETPVAAVRALFEDGRAGGGMTLLNAAPALAEGAQLFPLADVVIVNETELARYAGGQAEPRTMEEVVPLARQLISREGQSVVVTLGAAGVASVDAETAFLIPGRPAYVTDTTGAGDCLCGVLAASLCEGASLAEAMAEANAAAALSTETRGAAVSMPMRAAIAAFVAR